MKEDKELNQEVSYYVDSRTKSIIENFSDKKKANYIYNKKKANYIYNKLYDLMLITNSIHNNSSDEDEKISCELLYKKIESALDGAYDFQELIK